ncbi:MAG: radical SAM protein [Bacteroidota bacterium]
MAGNLFDSIIFGPLSSRRLGSSLGINLLPTTIKFCTFNCIYCECGWTEASRVEQAQFYRADEIRDLLEKRLIYLKEEKVEIDSLTFAGNGEPTVHPEFADIIADTIRLRNIYYPKAKISVLSNSTMLAHDEVLEALKKINNIMKLDAGTEKIFQLINMPRIHITLSAVVENLKKFHGKLIIQSMFLRGEMHGKIIDNTCDEEVNAWLAHIAAIKPKQVMLYSLDRRPPLAKLEKISKEELQIIADKVTQLNIKADVF